MSDQNLMNEATRLRSQGLSNDEIAQRLIYKGYTNAQVFDAMSQSDVMSVSEQGTMEYQPAQPTYPSYQETSMQMPSSQEHPVDASRIAEIAESIIEDKWSDLVDHVNKVTEWKASMELKLASMEEQLKSLRTDFEMLQKGVLGRIGETDNVMREVRTDIKALEQVFKKILPGFVENVNELSRITQRMKK